MEKQNGTVKLVRAIGRAVVAFALVSVYGYLLITGKPVTPEFTAFSFAVIGAYLGLDAIAKVMGKG